MPLLTGCINEALRLYPTATGISRISAADAEYGPHWLPRGSILLLDIYSAHRQAHTPALELPRTAHTPCIVSVCTYMRMATTAPDVRRCIAACLSALVTATTGTLIFGRSRLSFSLSAGFPAVIWDHAIQTHLCRLARAFAAALDAHLLCWRCRHAGHALAASPHAAAAYGNTWR